VLGDVLSVLLPDVEVDGERYRIEDAGAGDEVFRPGSFPGSFPGLEIPLAKLWTIPE
jgi:hypothetical protein